MIPDAWRRGEVAVVGLGRSGIAATRLLVHAGVRVYASDASEHPGGEDRLAELRALPGVAVEVGRHDPCADPPRGNGGGVAGRALGRAAAGRGARCRGSDRVGD